MITQKQKLKTKKNAPTPKKQHQKNKTNMEKN